MKLINKILKKRKTEEQKYYMRSDLMIFAEEFLSCSATIKDSLLLRDNKDYCVIGYLVSDDRFYNVISGEIYLYMFGKIYRDGRTFSKVGIEEHSKGIYGDDIDEYVCQNCYENVGNRPYIIIHERTSNMKNTTKFFKAWKSKKYSFEDLSIIKSEIDNAGYSYISLILGNLTKDNLYNC